MRLTTNALAALGVTMAVIAVPLGSGYVGGVRTFWERISDQPAAPSTSDPEATPLPSPAPAEAASPVPMTSPTAALPPPQQLTVQRRGETRWAESVYSAAFSPDGSRIAFVSKGGLLLLWDPTRGTSTSVNPQSLRVLHAKDSDLTSVDWGTDPTAPRILTTANDGHAVLWTSTVGTWSGQTVDLRDGRPALWGGVLSYDGSRIATVGADGIAKVIGLKPPSAVNIRVGSQGWSVAFSKDGTRVVTGGEGGAAPLKLWSVDGGEPLWASDSIPNVWVREVAIDPTGTLIAAASHDGQVLLWRNLTDPFIVLPGHSDQPAQSVAFNSDGSLIASAGDDGIVRVFDSATAASVATIPPVDQDKRIHSVRFSRQGRRLVIAGNSGWVRLYELLPAAAPADSPTPVGPGIPTRPSNQK